MATAENNNNNINNHNCDMDKVKEDGSNETNAVRDKKQGTVDDIGSGRDSNNDTVSGRSNCGKDSKNNGGSGIDSKDSTVNGKGSNNEGGSSRDSKYESVSGRESNNETVSGRDSSNGGVSDSTNDTGIGRDVGRHSNNDTVIVRAIHNETVSGRDNNNDNDSDSDSDNDTASRLLPTIDTAEAPSGPSKAKASRPGCVKRVVRTLSKKTVLNFTLATSLVMLTSITFHIFLVTQITSLEKEFGFTSLQSGHLLSASEIGYLTFVLPGGYLAHRLHAPRALSVSTVCVGVSGILSGLPHFIFPAASLHHDLSLSNTTGLNHSSSTATLSAATIPAAFCRVQDDAEPDSRCAAVLEAQIKGNNSVQTGSGSTQEVVFNERAYPVFVYLVACQVFRGITGSVRFPLFAEYIESNSIQTDTGFYFGILAAISMLGPAIGFMGGGAISQVHVSLKSTELTPTHPQWVGAWWLGMLVFGALTALAPVLLWRFPRRVALPRTTGNASPGSQEDFPADFEDVPVRDATQSDERRDGCIKVAFAIVAELKGFALSCLKMLLNLPLLFLLLSSCMLAFSWNGTYLFLNKYLQHQFNIPAWNANYIMGGGELLMGTTGFFMGGWLMRRLKLTMFGLYKLQILAIVLNALLVVALMFIGCPQPRLIGTPGQNETGNALCIASCACPEEVMLVCDRTTETNYFSPCHAGCTTVADGVYMNCSCTASGQVHPGQCSPRCLSVYFFSAVFYVFLFIASVTAPMAYSLLIRTVDKSQVGLAMGLNGFAVGIVGLLIGPMVFGGLIDSFCKHWRTSCGLKGQCSVYHNDRFRVQMHLYCIVAMCLGAVSYVISFVIFSYCSKPAKGTNLVLAEVEVGERSEETNREQAEKPEEEKGHLDVAPSEELNRRTDASNKPDSPEVDIHSNDDVTTDRCADQQPADPLHQ